MYLDRKSIRTFSQSRKTHAAPNPDYYNNNVSLKGLGLRVHEKGMMKTVEFRVKKLCRRPVKCKPSKIHLMKY